LFFVASECSFERRTVKGEDRQRGPKIARHLKSDQTAELGELKVGDYGRGVTGFQHMCER